MTSTQERKSGALLFCSYRKQHGNLTQKRLAHLLRVSRSMIAQIEHGERQPSRSLLTQLSQTLHLSPLEEAALFVAFGELPHRHQNSLACITALLRCDPSLTPEQAEALVHLVTSTFKRHMTTLMSHETFFDEIHLEHIHYPTQMKK